MEWNRETILHFISLIKQRPAIWDVNSPDYKIKRKRFESIEEVGLLMGVSSTEVSSKWIILRNQYSREKRKITESTGDSPYVTKWYAYKAMDTMMIRTKKRNKDFTNFWSLERESDDEDSSCSSQPNCRPPAPPTTEDTQAPKIENVVSLSLYNQAIKKLRVVRNQNNELDSDELLNYGLYIAAHLRRFSPPLQCKAKYEINKILYALDLESLGEYSVNIPTVKDCSDITLNTVAKECKFDPLQSEDASKE